MHDPTLDDTTLPSVADLTNVTSTWLCGPMLSAPRLPLHSQARRCRTRLNSAGITLHDSTQLYLQLLGYPWLALHYVPFTAVHQRYAPWLPILSSTLLASTGLDSPVRNLTSIYIPRLPFRDIAQLSETELDLPLPGCLCLTLQDEPKSNFPWLTFNATTHTSAPFSNVPFLGCQYGTKPNVPSRYATKLSFAPECGHRQRSWSLPVPHAVPSPMPDGCKHTD